MPAEMPDSEVLEQFHNALQQDDVSLMRSLFEKHPQFRSMLNEPVAAFNSPPISCVRSRRMLDLFLSLGADINAKSRWWAGGFGFLHSADRELAIYAIERGAIVDIHAAARLGMIDRVRECVAADASQVHARGGDGQTPLHFASTIEIAGFLIDHGANIDARDVDHESTPAQYMIRDRQEIARYLVTRGCRTDLLMAAALGDRTLAEKHLASTPESIRMRVNSEWFPMTNHQSGGTIYQWTLGWDLSAPQVANEFGHAALAEWLWARSPIEMQVIDACWQHDETRLNTLIRNRAGAAIPFTPSDLRHLAHAARKNDPSAVSLFLKAGLPLDSRGQHNATALHWAAWHGNGEMVKRLLAHGASLTATDSDFNGTPLGWAIHGSLNGWHKEKGEYGAVVQALLNAGAKCPEKIDGTPSVQAILRAARSHHERP